MINKLLIWLLFVTSAAPIFAEAETGVDATELRIGDPIEKVIEILGEPNGKMESGDFRIYYYKLGNVHMKSGNISSLNLISEETYESRRQAAAEAKEMRTLKGKVLLESIKADPEFAELPAENRLAFWEQFRSDYPEVDVYVLYVQAKVEAEKVLEQKREENRIAALEQRVVNAEIEARKAAEAVETQRLFEQTRYNNRYPSVVYYPQSYIIWKPEVDCAPNPTPYRRPVSRSGININLDGSFGSQRSSTTTNTSGFINGQNGVMRVQTSEGFLRSFY